MPDQFLINFYLALFIFLQFLYDNAISGVNEKETSGSYSSIKDFIVPHTHAPFTVFS